MDNVDWDSHDREPDDASRRRNFKVIEEIITDNHGDPQQQRIAEMYLWHCKYPESLKTEVERIRDIDLEHVACRSIT
jgi:hypothetical protein